MHKSALATVTRREFLHRTAWSSVVIPSMAMSFESVRPAEKAFAQEANKVSELPPLNRFSRMVQEWLVEQVRTAETQANERRGALKTKADAEAYVRSARERIRQSFGPEPERTPLNPKIMGVLERDTYRVEKILFESRPGMLVSANLYVPKGRAFPLPAVVASCGHSANGKAGDTYQSFAQSLARQGYVVLIYDPIGQGERLQFVDEQFKPRRGVAVAEHLYAGNPQFLVGEFFGMWRAWDGIRALDYLLTREEVDPKHVGITGNSGGGTMTTWLCGLESRWTMAAPGCFVTTFRRNAENELPADTEQCPPRAIALGLDHADFLAAMAPKPVIILAKERDFFDVRGSIEAYERLKSLYTLLGVPDNVALHIGPTEHGYTQENREAMYRFFNRVTNVDGPTSEPRLTIENDADLWCCPHGQVAELNSRTVLSFTQAASRTAKTKRGSVDGGTLAKALTEVLRLPEIPKVAPDYRILRVLKPRQYPLASATTYAVETEPKIHAVVTRLTDKPHYSRPPEEPRRAVLYVSHQSADVELRTEPLIKELLEQGAAFYACDVRGIGDSRPDTCGSDTFHSPYGSDFFYAAHAIMLDRPYVGQRTLDVLRVIDWLASVGHREVHLAAKGWGTLPALFAAVLSKHVVQVTLKQSLESYSAVAENEDYNWPLSSFAPGVLKQFDLDDCYRELQERKQLKLIDTQGSKATFAFS